MGVTECPQSVRVCAAAGRGPSASAPSPVPSSAVWGRLEMDPGAADGMYPAMPERAGTAQDPGRRDQGEPSAPWAE